MKKFDLNLGKWGPYNKEYCGILHIADEKTGATFNVELFPGFFRRSTVAASSLSDGGLKMWGANANLTRFCYRYELQWKDMVYCDAMFEVYGDKRCEISCTFHNNTNVSQSVNMNLCASLQYPKDRVKGYNLRSRALVPDNTVLVDAVDYEDILCDQELSQDGKYLGEAAVDYATGFGTAIGEDYYYDSRHFVRYKVNAMASDKIGVRYKCQSDTKLLCIINGSIQTELPLKATDDFSYTYVCFDKTRVESIELRPQGVGVCLDSICAGVSADKVSFEQVTLNLAPEKTISGNKMTLTYKDIEQTYTIESRQPVQLMRRFYCADIGVTLEKNVHNHVASVLYGTGEGVYDNMLSEPLFLEAGSEKTITFTITTDKKNEAEALPEPIYKVSANPDGEKYAFSQNMMAYNTFLNVVYPIYTRRQYIRHNTPGRLWDCLYTWDSGFIGMGLGAADFQRGFDCLHTYLTPEGDMHSPFIFHGSVVPTQIFLYKYLIDKYPEKNRELKNLYPMVMQYYRFFANMDAGKEQLPSGILKTWHIFYNSGGWDDYPPQKFVRTGDGEISQKNTTPVITTAITVLIAKIMKVISIKFGFETEAFDAVIKKYSDVIEAELWDEECGYFSYLVHDADGKPLKFLRYSDNSNYNMGFDGIYPYIAGITSKSQSDRILDNIKNGLMTDIGISVVDTRASYFSDSGYWNGSVWMSHQWILWKALLDYGETELAYEIAHKALEMWKKEVEETYCCFEHFMIKNGRGSGFHQFSGLSTPVLMFFETYYKPGTVTAGHRTLVNKQSWAGDFEEAYVECTSLTSASKIIVCMAEGKYAVEVNGEIVNTKTVTAGALEIPIQKGENHIKITHI
ncbi:MAG: hypothetical protein IJN74_02520 [Clostridia bacterium]|nr:hypothetical protein [Clostridia bacterium]